MLRKSKITTSFFGASISLVYLLVFSGCAKIPGPYVCKPLTCPAVHYCNDNTGHIKGTKPWIMGGTCCCTPTAELMKEYHRDGFCRGMDERQLSQQYENAGIKLQGPGHEWCNGLCDHGPHVVLGGKCMCPPTPGTEYYEQVIFCTTDLRTVNGDDGSKDKKTQNNKKQE